MGNIEKEVKKRDKRARLQKIILSTIFALGGLSVALIAPKMTKVLVKFEPEFMKDKYRKYSFNRSLVRLKDAGFIVFEKTERGNFACLTPKGKEKLRQLTIHNFKIKKPKNGMENGDYSCLILKKKEKALEIKFGIIYLKLDL